MKLLVFGANSQLGRELTRLLDYHEVDFAILSTAEVDVLKPKEVVKAVSRINPTQLINVATYTNLQKAEADPAAAKLCDQVNTDGVTALARVCEQLSIPIIHHSSSYVFDGQKKDTYTEEDEANPACRYGKSRWYGERTLREQTKRHIILRTDWLFSEFRDKYFRMILDACKQNGGKLGVIDNRFSPTWAADAARVIFAIVKQVDCNAEVWGTYHYNAMQPVKQDQFVEHVLEEAAKMDKELAKLLPSLEIELLPVELPYIHNSALNCEKIMATFGIKQHSRGEGVTAVLEKIYGITKAAPARKKNPKAARPTAKKTGRSNQAKASAKNKAAQAKSPTRSKRPAKKAARQKSSPSS